MPGVAEAYGVGACHGRDRSQALAGRVTLAAGADVSAARLPAGCVALITGLMRVQSGGSSTSYAAPRGSMTRRATRLRSRVSRAIHVLRVVKLRVEAAQCGESFERRVLLTETFLRVTDGAERTIGRVELRLMTIDALFVSGKLWLDGIIAALMADGTTPTPGQRGVRARI